MGRKFTVFNCRPRYKGDTYKGSVFGFPTDAEPASVFDFKPSCFQQGAPKKIRNKNTRRVSQSAREVAFELEENTVDTNYN